MKIKQYIPFLFILVILLAPAITKADEMGLMRLSLIEGEVQVLIPETTDWAPAGINLPLNEHDRIWIPGNSRAELQIKGGVYVRAKDATGLDILTVNRESAQFFLNVGHVYINNRDGGIGNVQIDTPMASLRSYDRSIFLVDVSDDGVTEISVMKGVVYAESRAGATQVSAGNTLAVRGENDAEISPIGSADAWERWNVERDREVSSWSASSRHLPDELQEYGADLDRSGRWDHVSGYGYVWSPVAVAPDWAPYSFGSWLWIRGNYVWVAYESWGWAPSHYGRWVFIGSRGWCWVPPARGSVYWAPGYVGWVVTSSYVAWVPLAPGEIYYGYGYYGPGSVNIATVNIDVIERNRSYRNARARNSVVVVRRDTFGTGRRTPVRIQENPFEQSERSRRDVNVVPPRTRPDRPVVVAPPEARGTHRSYSRGRTTAPGIERREAGSSPPVTGTREPAARNRPLRGETQRTPSAAQPSIQQPPEAIRRRGTESIKKERPLARQPETSVFQSQPPKDLPVTRSEQPHVNRKSSGTVQPQPGNQKKPESRRAFPRRNPEQRNPGR